MAIKPSVNRLYVKNIRAVNRDLAKRSVLFAVIKQPKTKCPNCKWDQTNSCSTGEYNGTGPKPFDSQTCPVCENKGELGGDTDVRIQGNVRWGKPDKQGSRVIISGDVKIGEVKIKVDIRDLPTMMAANEYKIDGIRCTRVGEANKRGLLNYVVAEIRAKIND